MTAYKILTRKILEFRKRDRFKFCVNSKTDIRYVISYYGQSQFFEVLPLLGEYPKGWLFLKLTA